MISDKTAPFSMRMAQWGTETIPDDDDDDDDDVVDDDDDDDDDDNNDDDYDVSLM